ncbi:MAG TPA: ABC transporter ATP-binding protein [Polyangia bacterium]|nr:ABC transporter ATP-binding protein [Polyangia bacterium]
MATPPSPAPAQSPRPPRPPWRDRLRETWRLLPHVRRTFAILWQTNRALTVAVAALALVGGVLPAALAWVGKLIVDAVVSAARAGGPHAAAAAVRLVLLELGLMIVSTLLGRLSALVRELLRAQLGNRINVDILEKALTLELRHFEDAAFYDKMQRARREASSRPLSMVLGLLGIAQSAISLGSYAVLLARLSPGSVVVLVLASIPAFVSEARLSSASFRLYSWRAPEARRLNYLEWLLTRDNHVKEVKLFGLGPLILGRYRALFDKFYREDRALAIKRFAYGLLLTLVSLGAFYACYAWAAGRAAGAAISLGDLTLYVMVFRQGQGAFQSLLGAVGGLYEDALFMSNLFAYFDHDIAAASAPFASGAPAAAEAPRPQTIEFRDVSFRYPGKDAWALRHINLTIAPGEVIALCGDNGAGKSTLIHLLMRFYEPTEGAIFYGGVALRDIDPAVLRRRIGAVFQDFVRYQFTAAENIGLGWIPALEDRARIEGAARAGGADAVVEQLPQRLDTMLGGYFEAGQELSVGQWQKVATARAFMRDAEVLILDEPTASLDAEAEHEMWKRFATLASGRTAILISHRMATVRLAGRIVVLKNGQIEEMGTHAELVARNGRYAHLFRLQAAGYLD